MSKNEDFWMRDSKRDPQSRQPPLPNQLPPLESTLEDLWPLKRLRKEKGYKNILESEMFAKIVRNKLHCKGVLDTNCSFKEN